MALASATRVAEAQVPRVSVSGATATTVGRDSAVVMANIAGPREGVEIYASYGPESQPADQDTSLGAVITGPPGWPYTLTGLTPDTTYRFTVADEHGNTFQITFTTLPPLPTATEVRLVSVISYTLDTEELNRLEIEQARREFTSLPRAVVFSCVSSDGMSVMVSDSAVRDEATGIHAWKLPKGDETPLQALGLGIRSDKIRDMSCQARYMGHGDHNRGP